MTKHLQNMQSLALVKELLQVNHSNTSIEIKTEPWNADYEAFRCELKGQTYMSRRAHKTPKNEDISLRCGVKMTIITTDHIKMLNFQCFSRQCY